MKTLTALFIALAFLAGSSAISFAQTPSTNSEINKEAPKKDKDAPKKHHKRSMKKKVSKTATK